MRTNGTRESITEWAGKHKGTIIGTGVVLVIAAGVVTLSVNRKKAGTLIAELGKIIPQEKSTTTIINTADKVLTEGEKIQIFPRSSFVRQLHTGWTASEAKIAQAKELGIELLPGETLVNPCMVTIRIA